MNKIITQIPKIVYIDKLDEIGNKHNNTYQSTTKMKPVNVKSNTYIDSIKEINNKDPKFKIDDIVKISKYENIFAKGYILNWSNKVFVIRKVKNTVQWTYMLLTILMEKKLLERFTKKNCKQQIKISLNLKK